MVNICGSAMNVGKLNGPRRPLGHANFGIINLPVSLFDFDAMRSQRYVVVGSDVSKKNFGSGLRVRHSQKLISNAIAAKEADTYASTGHELLLFEALQEGLEEEMDSDPHVCVMGEDVGHYRGSYVGWTEIHMYLMWTQLGLMLQYI